MTQDQPTPVGGAEPEHYVARIFDVLAKDVDRPVVRWQDTVISASELREAVLRVAAVVRGLGMDAGGTVAVLTELNSPWMLVARYAAHLLGAAVVHITGANHGTTTHSLSRDTRARMVRETGASVLVFDAVNSEEAEAIGALSATKLGLCGLGAPVFGSVSAGGHPVEDGPRQIEPRIPERATVIYTSGSTGRPKGVCKPFGAWNNVVLGESTGVAPKSFLAVSAVSHTGGLLVDMAIASGGSVLLRSKFAPRPFLQDIAEYRITDTLIGVPLLYELMNHPDVRTADLSSLRRLLYVGCPASPERVKEAVQLFPGVLNHSYGTTETGRIAMLTNADHDDPTLLDTVGRPRPDVKVVIRDPATGRELPNGQVGEVVVSGSNIMQGYVSDPELTAKVLRDGWVHTGDFGSLGDNGYLRLFGRMNDVAKVHDTRVHPSEVEKALVGHRGVVDACVYVHRRSDLVEELHAAVVLRADDKPSFETLREHVGRAMTPSHAPTRFSRWREFPINDSGKTDRVLVRARTLAAGTEDEELSVSD